MVARTSAGSTRRADGANDDAQHHERVATDAAKARKLHGAQVGDVDVCFAGARTKRQPEGE